MLASARICWASGGMREVQRDMRSMTEVLEWVGWMPPPMLVTSSVGK